MNADDQQEPAIQDEAPRDPDGAAKEPVGGDTDDSSGEAVLSDAETGDAGTETGDAGTETGDAGTETGDAESAVEVEVPESTTDPVSVKEKSAPKRAKAKRSKPTPIVEEADDEEPKMDWYILKVQSNRENSICDGLRRRVAIEGLDEFFGDVLVPTEDVAEFKNGKRRVTKRKLFPGYIVVNMVINDETWFLVRETPGIGDFTGAAGKPTPMLPHEVERIIKAVRPDEESVETIKTAIPFNVGDRIRIKDGTFENFEGDVDVIDEANGRVTIMINIFGRSTPVELEHWQIEAV